MKNDAASGWAISGTISYYIEVLPQMAQVQKTENSAVSTILRS